MKICKSCKVEKEYIDFVNKQNKILASCSSCRIQYMKQQHIINEIKEELENKKQCKSCKEEKNLCEFFIKKTFKDNLDDKKIKKFDFCLKCRYEYINKKKDDEYRCYF